MPGLFEDKQHHHSKLGGGYVQEIDEIFKIFRLLGTPNVETWPGVKELPDYKDCFPKWIAKPLHEVLPDNAAHRC